MNEILEKRTSLERFIREQTIGPGINGYRYVNLENDQLTNFDLLRKPPIENTEEILDIVPAAIYSTGILFPEDGSQTTEIGIGLDNNEIINSEEIEAENDSQDDSSENIDTVDSAAIDQRYPRSMGFTFCLDETFLKEGKLEIKFEFRYYKKVSRDKESSFNSKYALLCETGKELTQQFITSRGLNEFGIRIVKSNVFIVLNRMKDVDLKNYRNQLRLIRKEIAEILYDKTVRLVTLSNLGRASCNISNLKSSIYYELKNKIIDANTKIDLYKITQEIEVNESITDQLLNLIDINSGGYGLWESELITRQIKIDNILFPKALKKKILLHNKRDYNEIITVKDINENIISNSLDEIFVNDLPEYGPNNKSQLSANIQFNRNTRNDENKVFIKLQIINTSSPFTIGQNSNLYYSTFNEHVNQKSFFGNRLSINNQHLTPYNEFKLKNNDSYFDEDQTTHFIYRQYSDYGLGHGCSVNWNKNAKLVETEYLPTCETPDVDPIPRNKNERAILSGEEFKDPLFLNNSKAQEFKWLSTLSNASDSEIVELLNGFIDSYSTWIDIKRAKYNQSEFSSIANQELDRCQNDFARMKRNINVFLAGSRNFENMETFRLMNTAMFMQLWHSVKVKSNVVNDYLDKSDPNGLDINFYKIIADDKLFSANESASWRAFQLAFILLNLDGIFKVADDYSWDKRNNLVDLLWFPTGGGKTEAYLGLIALTIINRRRLHGPSGGGTAALIRYTLRLLTLQQFERATLVVMALELLRRWGIFKLGEEPIYIGLWVGDNSLPNRLKDLSSEYWKQQSGTQNRIPFNKCPWCGSKLRNSTNIITNQRDVFNFNRIHLHCDNNKCPFTEPGFFDENPVKGPIPINLCDESIYQHPPALLFGTVDKFAQLAHKINGSPQGRANDSRRIFGKGNWEAKKPAAGYLPPDLIIQDELHLLLGPLGSAVALFESAIDQLCTRLDGTRPKIISSTATTRNTALQISALFDRKVELFPKQGVECDDSFFAYYKRKYFNEKKEGEEYISKRKYIGILPTGRTQIWMQMRIAAIIMTHKALFELQNLGDSGPFEYSKYKMFEKAMNYYHTTISYFNSLKEVGKTQSQIQSYILKELRRVFTRVIRPNKLMGPIYTYGPIKEVELTGRLSGEEVKKALNKVETNWVAENRFAHQVDSEIKFGTIPPDFVVATNMISVGIDVSRFNLIIMNSMPRNTAEYIQASSRVARDSSGLVLTIHHPFRARDFSHYEKFIEFHEKMYSYVEPISITPFTQKAVERYFGLYLATIIRHKNDRFTDRLSADRISALSEREINFIIEQLMQYFNDRQKRLSSSGETIRNLLKSKNIIQIKKWVEEAVAEWKDESDRTLFDGNVFVFNNKKSANRIQEQLYVDIEEYEGNIQGTKWQIPESLRVIEPEAAIKIYPK